ncbi:MAG: hypothetical protein OEV00_11855 [Acidobacteriota bacterium]|nr:hypothetical protein [Acidobacteriota bacterium]MDH3786006.1 hypothetical protein [Acidobacteriota bacterium]
MARRKLQKPGLIVNYDFKDRTYQIDPDLKKVYRRFVEIETSKASEILASWRATAVVTA